MSTGTLTRNFFELDGTALDVDSDSFVIRLKDPSRICENLLYRPPSLNNPRSPGRYRVKDITFRNVSLSYTVITGFEFTSCTFERCLFLSTIFRDCRFTDCSFLDSNPNRIEFKECFVDPASFDGCVLDRRYSNIGVYLFQELLRNSRQQAQPGFSDEAQYRFKAWERHQLRESISKIKSLPLKILPWIKLFLLDTFDTLAGSGMRLGRLARSSFGLLLVFTLCNWFFASPMGLSKSGNFDGSLANAFYFSAVVATTLGFGDIYPTTTLGRIVVSGEAIISFVTFALLTSSMYRKFTS